MQSARNVLAVVDDMGLLCLVVSSGASGKIVGRTKLQKIVYFCQYLNWDVNDYRFHYYGPFSFGVANIVKTARDCGFVDQAGDMPCTFSITKKGSEFLGEFKANACSESKAKKTQRLVAHLSVWSKKDLELAASIDYVRKSNPGISKNELLDKIKAIKSNFSQAEIKNAHSLWQKLKRQIPRLK